MPKQRYEGNLYDKIFKENAEHIFMPLVEKQLGTKIKRFTPLKEKMQTTLEREMDFFYEVETMDGEIFILHLEFQSENDDDMLYRGAEYHGMALRRKQMPIKHLVIYLGSRKPTMRTQLKPEEIYKGFDIVNVHALDTTELLASQVPEVILLAILTAYKKEQTEAVLRLIVSSLKSVSKNQNQLSKYLKQLVILARLRKLEDLTIKIVKAMPITYDISTDSLYLQGIEKGIATGIQKGREQEAQRKTKIVVKRLLKNGTLPDTSIAFIAEVTTEFIQVMKLEIQVEDLLQKNVSIAEIAKTISKTVEWVEAIQKQWLLEKKKQAENDKSE